MVFSHASAIGGDGDGGGGEGGGGGGLGEGAVISAVTPDADRARGWCC